MLTKLLTENVKYTITAFVYPFCAHLKIMSKEESLVPPFQNLDT